MADALTALEIVEGLEEYMKQSDSNVLQSPTSVAKLPPNTATRATRRKTAVKAEPQPSSSQLVNRSCRLTSKKSLDGEMDQENVTQEPNNNNVKFEANAAKTPAAKKDPGATSCSSKVQESKNGELVHSAYSTRRSTRLLEKCMADLSLKTKETLEKSDKVEETGQKVSAEEKNPAGSEERIGNTEVVPGRDLSASMEKECEIFKHDNDQVTGDLGDIAVSDVNSETNNEDNEVMNDEKESENSLVQVNKQEEALQADKAISEEVSEKHDKDQDIEDTEIHDDLGDIPVLEHANTETYTDDKEFKNVQAFDSSVQIEHHETEDAIQEKISETEKTNTFDERAVVNRTDGDLEAEPEEDSSGVDSDGTDSNQAENQEREQAIQENDFEIENTNTVDGDTMVDQTDSVSEAEENNSGVDSDDTISEADSNQTNNQEREHAIQENDSETEEINSFDKDRMVDQTNGDSVLKHANSEIINDNKESKNAQDFDSLVQVEHQETGEAIQEKDSEPEKANTFDEEAVVDQIYGDSEADSSGVESDGTISEGDSNQADNQETEQATQENDSETEKIYTFHEDTMVDQTDADLEGDHSGVDSDVTISEADAVHGSDIAEAELILSEPEGSVITPTSPLLLEEAIVNTATLSPFVAESISAQFPRPNKPASKNSAMKVDNVGTTDKENNMEMMMMNVVNKSGNGESKGETKKKKKVEMDEENLKDVSIRQLVKMVKELSIKSSNNRTALQILPGNNQIAD